MPSFDIVSEVDFNEVKNAVDQANREISNRFDFKGSDARVEQKEALLTVFADDEFKIGQALDILKTKLAKRSVELSSLESGDVLEVSGGSAKQDITIRHGIDKDLAKKLVKQIKDSKLKVQAAIQGEQLRITGKKRDDLQDVIAEVKKAEFGIPLQYVNFRD